MKKLRHGSEVLVRSRAFFSQSCSGDREPQASDCHSSCHRCVSKLSVERVWVGVKSNNPQKRWVSNNKNSFRLHLWSDANPICKSHPRLKALGLLGWKKGALPWTLPEKSVKVRLATAHAVRILLVWACVIRTPKTIVLWALSKAPHVTHQHMGVSKLTVDAALGLMLPCLTRESIYF